VGGLFREFTKFIEVYSRLINLPPNRRLRSLSRFVWDYSAASPITIADALSAQPLVEEKLDESFFRVRIERATPVERQYMTAMAECGLGPHMAGEVAERLGKHAQQTAPTRARLIEKGLLYAPSYGSAAFTVPQFDRYLLRLASS
jgi:hypothetical protein